MHQYPWRDYFPSCFLCNKDWEDSNESRQIFGPVLQWLHSMVANNTSSLWSNWSLASCPSYKTGVLTSKNAINKLCIKLGEYLGQYLTSLVCLAKLKIAWKKYRVAKKEAWALQRYFWITKLLGRPMIEMWQRRIWWSVGIQTAALLVTLWIYFGHPVYNKRTSWSFGFHLSITLAVIWIFSTVAGSKNWMLSKESLRVSSHSILINLVKNYDYN